jgi:GT2 family glycosyltransferase
MNNTALGVVIVTYNASDVILDCLETLLSAALADGIALRVAVVDNASSDDTVARIKSWAAGETPYVAPGDLPFDSAPVPKPLSLGAPSQGTSVHLLEEPANGGFAFGVNVGLAALAKDPEVDRFWILNPDSAVPQGSVAAFARHEAGPDGFSLMGGRVVYLEAPDKIQSDGGLINRKTGVTHNKNQFSGLQTALPDPAALDFISGASMVASRAFYEAAGPLPEDYFLYYEEVDWALQRGALPLSYCPEALIYHRSGTSIGSSGVNRLASPFSTYFLYRARTRFVRRFFPASLPVAIAYCCAKAAQLTLKGYRKEAQAVLQGCFNRPPPAYVTSVMSPEARKIAFPEHKNV